MAGVVGIDPGVVHMGIAHVRRGRWVASETYRGARGCGADWTLLASTAALQAERAVLWALARDPELVAIETFVHQAGRGRVSSAALRTTAAACMALWSAFAREEALDLVRWQDAQEVLRHDRGYGDLRYLLTQGRGGIDAPGKLGDHEAAAVCHALWAETVAHAPMAGLSSR